MSIQAVNWVLEHSTSKGAQRLVMISLANHADERGEAWPSVQRIADESNSSVAYVKRALADLETAGHITKDVNAAPDSRMRGDRKTNLYRIMDGGALKYPPWLDGGHSCTTTGVTSTHERGSPEVPPNHQENHQLEPKPLSADADFEAFWVEYPKARRTAKPDARAAFKIAVKKVPAEQIIVAVKRYAADPNRVDEFTPYPQKWLKQERWNAPPEIRRAVPAGRVAQSTSNIDRIQNTILGGGQKAIG